MQLSLTNAISTNAITTNERQDVEQLASAHSSVQLPQKVNAQHLADSVQRDSAAQRLKNNEYSSTQTKSNKQPRLDIDEQALAQVEQFKQQQDDVLSVAEKALSSQNSANSSFTDSNDATLSGSNLASTIQPSSEQSRSEQSSYDQSSINQSRRDESNERNLSAVSAYQSVGSLAQRESVQQLFGVDLYA